MWIRLRRATVCEVRIPRGASDALCGKPRVPAANQVRRDGPYGTLSPNEEGGLVARARATYLSEREKDFLHEKTLEVLEKVGVAYNTPQAIDLLASAGAEVDRDALTAKLTWDIIEACLKTAPKKVLLAGRRPEDDRVLGEWPLHTITDGIQTYVYDDLTGRRREGTAADLETFVKLGDALSEVDTIWPSPQASDIDPYMLPVKFAELTIRNTSKHVQDEVREPDLVEPILAMYEAAAGAPLTERPYFSVTNCTIAPLQHDAEMTEAHVLMARAGCPIFVLPMPQMGTTGPMSVLGTSILNMAELLSAVVLFQLAAPGCAMVSAVGSAVAEMRSGLYLSGTPEDGLINLTCIEMSKFYGMRSQGSAVSCDAKACDLQAGAEGMLTGLATALAGADVMLAFGLMDSAQTASLAKTVLDADTVSAIERFLRDDPVDEARALVDDIVAVGIGGHYLTRKSTRQFYRAGELWQPKLWHREPFERYVDNPLVKDAWEQAHALIEKSDVPPLPEDVQRHVGTLIADYLRRRDR